MNESLSSLTTQAVSLLCQMVSTPSISREEDNAASLLEHFMSEQGLNPKRHENNLWVIAPSYDKARPTLMLNAHIDTVPPATSWTHNPFAPTLEGDKLFGLGTNDDGASLVTLLQVFRTLSSKPQPYNLLFLASAEEEVSGNKGIEAVLPLLPPISVALVGEPTGMQPAIAEKGLMVIDATAHGRSGHAARNEGDNAILRAIDDIQRLCNLRFPLVSKLLGQVKTTVTIIHAGTRHNIVPDSCTFTIDVRSNELYSNQEILNILRQELSSELKPRSLRLNSSHISTNHPLVRRAVELGLTPFGSPTLSDRALMPFPALKLGPGQPSRSHSADEYVLISEIEHALKTYLKLLDNLHL